MLRRSNPFRFDSSSSASLCSVQLPLRFACFVSVDLGFFGAASPLDSCVCATSFQVEATKFTEVGFHGQDVDRIIKDLVEVKNVEA